MPVELRSEELGTLLETAATRKLLLPNFQRDFVWTLDAQKDLATSLLLEVPIGSLLLLTGTTDDFSARPIGKQTRATFVNLTECEYVLDGQQRLSTLYSLIADPFAPPAWEDMVRSTFWNLRYRWGLRVVPGNEDEDLFGFNELSFEPLPTEPDDVRVRFEPMRVLLGTSAPKGGSSWHHPAWKADEPANARKLAIVNAAAATGTVPLWRIAAEGDGPDALHVRVLRKIAQSRVEVLRAMLADTTAPPALYSALRNVRPELETGSTLAEYTDALSDLRADWVQSVSRLLVAMATYRVPVVELPVSKVDRAIVIFESMNRGGTPLSTFDLLTARLARSPEPQNLSELIFERISSCEIEISDELWGSLAGQRPKQWRPARDVVGLARDAPSTTFKNAFLSMLPLLSALDSGKEFTVATMKQTAILRVTSDQVQKFWAPATDAIMRAWAFLQIRCGVRNENDLRNKLLVIPAALTLRSEDALNNKKLLDRLEYWYWASVLTSTYTEHQNENAVEDAKMLLTWAATGSAAENPFLRRKSLALRTPGYSDSAVLLREHEDAGVATDVGMYLLQYELSSAPYDLLSDCERLHAWEQSTEDHHLVPLGTAKTILESTQAIRRSKDGGGIGRLLNSPLNRSLISSAANRKIGAMPIQQYFKGVPDVARVARGVPDLETLNASGVTEETARAVMRNRYTTLLDRVHAELDSLA